MPPVCQLQKIIQISAAQSTDLDGSACWVLYALDSDGSVWAYNSKDKTWAKIPDLFT